MYRTGGYILFTLFLLCVAGVLGVTNISRGRRGEGRPTGLTDKTIFDFLLNTTRYDKSIRPSGYTVVNMSVVLLTMCSPDESSSEYQIEFVLRQEWFDTRLKFDGGGHHEYLNGLKHADDIWVPDIYIVMHGEMKETNPSHMSLRIHPDGTVTYSMRRNMVLKCEGDNNIFPFDNVKCPFALESLSLDKNELELQWSTRDVPVSYASSLRQHNSYLIENTTGLCDQEHTWRGDHSCLKVLLVFTRDKSYFLTTVFMPGILFVLVSFTAFWIDRDNVTPRVIIGLISLLTMAIISLSFRYTLSVTANLNALNHWNGFCIVFILGTLLQSNTVHYVRRKIAKNASRKGSDPLAESSQKATNTVEIAETSFQDRPAGTESATPTSEDAALPKSKNGTQRDKPSVIAALIAWLRKKMQNPTAFGDIIARIAFPLLFVIFIFVYFVHYGIVKAG